MTEGRLYSNILVWFNSINVHCSNKKKPKNILCFCPRHDLLCHEDEFLFTFKGYETPPPPLSYEAQCHQAVQPSEAKLNLRLTSIVLQPVIFIEVSKS